MTFTLTCPALPANHCIPVEITCDGGNRAPALSWSNAPLGTKSFTLIMHDPDSHHGDFTHWLLYDIPPNCHHLSPGSSAEPGLMGTNGFGHLGYGGPCPPAGDKPHRYIFDLFALDESSLKLGSGAERRSVEAAIKDHVLGEASCIGTYARQPTHSKTPAASR